MTPDQINRTIAQNKGWKPSLVDWWVHSDENKSLCFSGTQRECLQWRESLPNESPYKNWEVIPHYSDPPNYLDEKNPGPAHELIEVLRGEGCFITITISVLGTEIGVVFEGVHYHAGIKRQGAPAFCRAVCEAYLKVRGKLLP